jgi:hypothetical protein
MRKRLLGSSVVVILLLSLVAMANPGVTACAISGFSTSSYVPDSKATRDLQEAARLRVKHFLGDENTSSTPRLIFLSETNTFGWFKLNPYGSTHFVGPLACVFIGTEGRNVDVVSHELLHAEIFERIGTWVRMTQLPTWFDEGLAMQVDTRSNYDSAHLSENDLTFDVTQLSSPSAFFAESDAELTRNYRLAKLRVFKRFQSKNDHSEFVKRLAQGISFDTLWNEK